MEKYRFLLSGSGGQGVITMAILLAEAAVLYEGLTAVQSQAYGQRHVAELPGPMSSFPTAPSIFQKSRRRTFSWP